MKIKPVVKINPVGGDGEVWCSPVVEMTEASQFEAAAEMLATLWAQIVERQQAEGLSWQVVGFDGENRWAAHPRPDEISRAAVLKEVLRCDKSVHPQNTIPTPFPFTFRLYLLKSSEREKRILTNLRRAGCIPCTRAGNSAATSLCPRCKTMHGEGAICGPFLRPSPAAGDAAERCEACQGTGEAAPCAACLTCWGDGWRRG